MPVTTFEKVSRDPAFQELFLRGHRRALPKNQVALHEGETPRALYFLMSGTVSVRLSNWHGREVLLAYLHAGDFFGEMCLFPDVPARSAMIRTMTDCQVLEIPYPQFIELASKHPALWLELAGQLAYRLRATNRRLAEMPVLPAAERIWSVLMELSERSGVPCDGQGVSVRITREDLGKLAGCSREVAGTVLRKFAETGHLNLQGHRIVLPLNSRDLPAPVFD